MVLFFFVFISKEGLTQSTLIIDDSTKSSFIGRHIYFFQDKDNAFSYSDISSESNKHLFAKCEKDKLMLGNSELTVWSRFSILNHSSKVWFLSVMNYNIDTLTLFYRDKEGKTQQVITGSSQPASSREFRTGMYSFKLPLIKDDTVTFYMRGTGYKPEYPIYLSEEREFIYDLHINNLLKGLYYGLALMFIIYNSLLFFKLFDRNYLYFTINIIFTALLQAEHAGVNAYIWGDKFHFLWNRGPLILAIGSLFFILYSKSLLETKKYVPLAHKFINYVLIPMVVLCMFFNIIDKNLYSSVLNQITGIMILLFMSFTAVVVYRRGFKPARFYILACSFYFVGVVVFILKTFALISYNYLTQNSMEIGSAAMMMLFGLSMADRMKIFKTEKAVAQKQLMNSMKKNEILISEQNKILEKKVDLRTRELKKTLGELEVSQQALMENNNIISFEKERSDALLLNILPGEVAEELKEKGSAKAKQFDQVTVMFTDFKDFTKVSEKLSPTELVGEIDTCFRAFDEIISKHNVEKIKTIGDSYMCVGGLPIENGTNATDIVNAAIEIGKFMNQHQIQRESLGLIAFEIRIGVHTGPVVAGIVGSKKFAYDIWGDTVNTASRMESSGEAGKINISETTYDLVKEKFICTYRGKINAKGKGEIDMYFVDSAR